MAKARKNIVANDVLLKIRIAIASGKEELLPRLNEELRNIFFIYEEIK